MRKRDRRDRPDAVEADPPRERAEPRRSGSEEILALQRSMGNAAVASMVLARTPTGTAKAPAKLAGRELGRALEARVDRVAAEVQRRQDEIIKAIKDGVGQIDASVISLNEVCDEYETVYERVQRTIKRGEGELAAKEAFVSAILGVMIGTGIGMALSSVGTLSKSAVKLGEALGEMGGEVAEWTVGKGFDALRSGSGGATGAAVLANANPLLKRLDVYRDADSARRELALLATGLSPVNDLGRWCSTTKADSRELAVSGRHDKLKPDELEHRVQLLEGMGEKLTGVDTATRAVAGRASDAAARAGKAKLDLDPVRMERYLWLRWMAALSDDERDVLGTGVVRDRLEAMEIKGPYIKYPTGESRIGWYFGDEDEGVEKAQWAVMALDYIGRVGTAIVPPDEYGGTRSSRTPDVKFPGVAFNPARPGRQWGVILDAEVSDGEQVLITGVFGQTYSPNNEYSFYGRPTKPGQDEKALDEKQKGRTRQLI